MNIRFDPEPAKLFDLFRVIAIGYNYGTCDEFLKRSGIKVDTTISESFNYVWNGLDKTTPGLGLFFISKAAKNSFAAYMFTELLLELKTIEAFIKYFKKMDHNWLYKGIINYYSDFADNSEDFIKVLPDDINSIYSFINGLDIPLTVKWEMMTIFIKPQIIIDPLVDLFSELKNRIDYVYTEHSDLLKQFEEKINTKIKASKNDGLFIRDEFEQLDLNISFDRYKSVCITFGVFNEILIYTLRNKDELLIFLGVNYEKRIDMGESKLNLEQMEEFLKVIADSSRLKILKMLLRSEMCSGEIAKALGYKNQITSYHLSLLNTAGLVKSRNDGKQVFYSINDKLIAKRLDAVKIGLISM